MSHASWSPDLFRARRGRILEALGPDAALVIPAAPEVVVGRDIELPYRPDPDLWYLTGYAEPEAVLVLCPAADDPFTLFVRDRDPERELWTGPREDVEAAGERVGADAACAVLELEDVLPDLLKGTRRIYLPLGGASPEEDLVLEILGRGRSARQKTGQGPAELADAGLLLDELRLLKGPEEIRAMEEAAEITAAAFLEGFAAVRPGAGEWEVEGAVDGAFRRAGAQGSAFTTIAASGANATVLHYTRNDRVMAAGELLLLDAGARHRMYSADVTRTLPVGSQGDIPAPAREVYDAVLEANRAGIRAIAPGAPLAGVHEAVLDVLLPALVELGVVAGRPADLRDREDAWKPYFPHSTSHWLGLDVHDVGAYKVAGASRPLEPGMVLTVEPGLYFPPDDPDVPEALRGIGVRIEDDVVVTSDGHRVLTRAIPTDLDELAALTG